MEIISERRRVEETIYELVADGWGFPATENGEIDTSSMTEEAKRNWLRLKEEGVEFSFEMRRYTYTEPAKGICECGKQIELTNQFLSACECPYCGRWHNMFGNLLKSPDQWGFV